MFVTEHQFATFSRNIRRA